jgi:type II secretory pathway pseudopilin PulG
MRRLINVLVVVLVLVLAAGVVLAAIPKVRDAADRARCRNNLKQIGLALTNYHETYGSYPSAAAPNDALPCGKRLGWLVDTVPFVEQINVIIDRTKAWDTEGNLVPRTRYVDSNDEFPLGEIMVFRCPSNPAVADSGRPGLTHYVGVAGVGKDSAELALGYPGAGFFGCDRTLKPEDIKDGTANTMAAIETNWRNGPWTASGFPTVRGLDPSGGAYLGRGGLFGSGHRHVTHAVFADGSVRGIPDSIHPDVLEALATVGGGEKTDPVGASASVRNAEPNSSYNKQRKFL